MVVWVYKTAEHSGSLEGCLKTEQVITRDVALALIKGHVYEFYAYDERINAYRFIKENMHLNAGLPLWLHCYCLSYRGKH